MSVSQAPTVQAQPPIVTTGRLVSRVSFDREEISMYQLSILAMDMSDRPLNMSIPVTVMIEDRNDISPSFADDSLSFNILEGTRATLVTELLVSTTHLV